MSPTVPPTSVMTTSYSFLLPSSDAAFDFVGDVRYDLYRLAEEIAAAFLVDDRLVNLALVTLLAFEVVIEVKRS